MVRFIPPGDDVGFLSGSKDIQPFRKCVCLGLVLSRLKKSEHHRVGLASID